MSGDGAYEGMGPGPGSRERDVAGALSEMGADGPAFAEAARGAYSEEVPGELRARHLAAIHAAARTVPAVPAAGEARMSRWQLLRSKAARAGAVAVAAVVTTGGLAAAGALPGPVQNAVADVASKIGVHIPRDDDRDGRHEDHARLAPRESPAPSPTPTEIEPGDDGRGGDDSGRGRGGGDDRSGRGRGEDRSGHDARDDHSGRDRGDDHSGSGSDHSGSGDDHSRADDHSGSGSGSGDDHSGGSGSGSGDDHSGSGGSGSGGDHSGSGTSGPDDSTSGGSGSGGGDDRFGSGSSGSSDDEVSGSGGSGSGSSGGGTDLADDDSN